ncbi:AAA family ATPase [Novipirellula rosea]|uniref:HTH arsR-type domain-containing protein n=1 Tax=Novipirellula rosea TaxID=1031540 RepID=A0ABP8NK03_9BACT
MIRRFLLSAFTPSNTDPQLLERIFVQREKLLYAITNRLARSMTSGEKHHVLLIGPRGSGKTNLVTLVVHRLRQQKELNDTMRIAWLGEDDVMVELIDIALAIADSLTKEYPEEFSSDVRSAVRGLTGDDAAIAVLNLICDQLQHRNLLVVMENLDRVFAGLGDLGQKRWRAFLQETTRIATLATSQQVFEGVSSRNEAFFGFFDLHHLTPLSVEDARALIRKIATEQGKLDLVKFLDSPTGRYRVRALHHLAGGNHRMYVLLSEYLTKDSLDDLIESFERLAEELTPYFQERLRSVPPQQAKLVQCLANAAGAKTVKEIAEETFIAERNCSKQLGNLRQSGYVISSKRGKESYYELAEPLMRLCLEVKNQRGRPLKLVAKFLKVWFPASRLDASINRTNERWSRGDQYRLEAIGLSNDFEDTIKDGLSIEIRNMIDKGDLPSATKLVEELECVDGAEALRLGAAVALHKQNVEHAIELLTKLISLPNLSVTRRVQALSARGAAQGMRGDTESEIADYSAIIGMSEASEKERANALSIRGVVRGEQGESELAIADYSAIINMHEELTDVKAKALLNRGIHYGMAGETQLEIADYTTIIEMTNAPPDQRAKALLNRGFVYGQISESELELADYSAIIDMPGVPIKECAKALLNRGIRHGERGKPELEVIDYSTVIEMPNAPAEQKVRALLCRSVWYGQRGQEALEIADCTTIIEMPDTPAEHRAKAFLIRGISHHRLEESELALNDFDAIVGMPHALPDTKSSALNNIAALHFESGRLEQSLEFFDAALQVTGKSRKLRTKILFSKPEPMAALGEASVTIEALREAFETGDCNCVDYGGTPGALLSTILRHSPMDWSDYADALVPLFVEHGVGAKLGKGIVESIGKLDEGEFSDSQLELWNDAWQSAGKECDELELSLRCLDAAVEVLQMDKPSDRPLFRLPLEIRGIVRDLLTNTLGPTA